MKFTTGQYTTENGHIANVTSVLASIIPNPRGNKIMGNIEGVLSNTWWWEDGTHHRMSAFNLKESTMEEKDNEMIVNALSNQGFKTVDDVRKENIVNIQEQTTRWNSDYESEITICCYCARLCLLDDRTTWCEHAIKETFHTEGEFGEYEVHGILFSFDRSKIPVYDPKLDSFQWCRCPKCDYVRMCRVSDDGDHISFSCTNCQFLDVDGIEIPFEYTTEELDDPFDVPG
jgi:hypothetical protein